MVHGVCCTLVGVDCRPAAVCKRVHVGRFIQMEVALFRRRTPLLRNPAPTQEKAPFGTEALPLWLHKRGHEALPLCFHKRGHLHLLRCSPPLVMHGAHVRMGHRTKG